MCIAATGFTVMNAPVLYWLARQRAQRCAQLSPEHPVAHTACLQAPSGTRSAPVSWRSPCASCGRIVAVVLEEVIRLHFRVLRDYALHDGRSLN
jgi:hypothetical protein